VKALLDEPLAAGPAPRPAPAAPLRVAALGGGTGLPRVLAGLSAIPAARRALDVTAIVATTDDGGSSGELRRRYGLPSPGDVRNCLVALAPGPGALASLFQHRFGGEGGLAGHTVGNVVLTALAQRLGSFDAAVRAAGELLGARGRVVPATARSVSLVATLDDGRVVRGETAIASARGRVGLLAIDGPAPAPAEALEALAAADVVVLGPGSLYSSLVATLLCGGIGEALARSRALRLLVVNLFTQPGETDGYSASDHLRAIERHAGRVVDAALVHARPLPAPIRRAYAARGSHPVRVDRAALRALGVQVVEDDLLASGGVARHDPARLAERILASAAAR
jgi:uncharacterized cofD-like protein